MLQKPEILKRTIVAASKLFRIEELHLKFSNGNERIFERMVSSRRGAVMIVPLIDVDTILLVREYAAGTDRYELAFPKGLVDDGETLEEAVNRELQEEIGYGSANIQLLRSMTAAPGYWGGKASVYIAKDLYPSKLEGDEPEPLEVVPWKLSNYQALLQDENFSEARSIAALLLLREYLHAN